MGTYITRIHKELCIQKHNKNISIFYGMYSTTTYSSADSRFASSQWEALLQSNTVSHRLGANLESAPLQYDGYRLKTIPSQRPAAMFRIPPPSGPSCYEQAHYFVQEEQNISEMAIPSI